MMGAVNRDDSELLRAAVADREAFAAFYRTYASVLERWFAVRAGREGTVASELTAETFAEALRSLRSFRGTEPGSGAAWLFGIARNLAREHHRRGRVRDDARRAVGLYVAASPDEGFDAVEQLVDVELLRGQLREAVLELPPAQRRAVELRVLDELGYGQIARRLGSSEQSARLRVSRGLRTLRRRLMTEQEER
jgi:RNA polymerase sigma factor (sigma-70 family)